MKKQMFTAVASFLAIASLVAPALAAAPTSPAPRKARAAAAPTAETEPTPAPAQAAQLLAGPAEVASYIPPAVPPAEGDVHADALTINF